MKKLYSKPMVILTFVFCTFQVAAGLFLPACMGTIVNEGILKTDLEAIKQTGIIMLVAALLMGVFGYLTFTISNVAALKFTYRLRGRLFRKITTLSTKRINKFGSGSIITRMTVDSDKLSNALTLFIELLYKPVLMTVGGLILLFRINSDFGIVFAIFVVIQVLLIVGFVLKIAPIFEKVQKIIDRINSKLQDTLRNLRLIKVQLREDEEQEKFGEVNRSLYNNNIRIISIISFFNPIMMFILNLTIIFIIVILGLNAGSSHNAVGNIMMVITYSEQVLMSIMASSNIAKSMSEIIPSYKRINEILEAQPEPQCSKKIDFKINNLDVDNISYCYEKDKYIIKNIDFRLNSGDFLYVYGGTGDGKTTLSLILGGFIKPTSGSLNLNGIPLYSFKTEDVKRKIAVVSNISNSIFDGTLLENISLYRRDISRSDSEKALETAMLGDYINTLPYGIDSLMNSSGNSLSGGQKQRLMMARALASNPDVLIIDDATSSLDFATEEKLFDKISKNYPDTIVIFITQRINKMRNSSGCISLIEGGAA